MMKNIYSTSDFNSLWLKWFISEYFIPWKKAGMQEELHSYHRIPQSLHEDLHDNHPCRQIWGDPLQTSADP